MFVIASQRRSVVASRIAHLSVAVVVTVGLGTSAGSGVAEAKSHSAKSLDKRTTSTSHVSGKHSHAKAGKSIRRVSAKSSGRKIG